MVSSPGSEPSASATASTPLSGAASSPSASGAAPTASGAAGSSGSSGFSGVSAASGFFGAPAPARSSVPCPLCLPTASGPASCAAPEDSAGGSSWFRTLVSGLRSPIEVSLVRARGTCVPRDGRTGTSRVLTQMPVVVRAGRSAPPPEVRSAIATRRRGQRNRSPFEEGGGKSMATASYDWGPHAAWRERSALSGARACWSLSPRRAYGNCSRPGSAYGPGPKSCARPSRSAPKRPGSGDRGRARVGGTACGTPPARSGSASPPAPPAARRSAR